MYRIIDERGTGKTGRLLLLAKENNGIIVCANPDRMRERAHLYGLTGIDFLSYSDYGEFLCGHRHGLEGRKIFIDELDTFLSSICTNIKGYTLSLE
jgi:hypothetical protein